MTAAGNSRQARDGEPPLADASEMIEAQLTTRPPASATRRTAGDRFGPRSGCANRGSDGGGCRRIRRLGLACWRVPELAARRCDLVRAPSGQPGYGELVGANHRVMPPVRVYAGHEPPVLRALPVRRLAVWTASAGTAMGSSPGWLRGTWWSSR